MNKESMNRQRLCAIVFTVLFGLGLAAMVGGCSNTARGFGSTLSGVGQFFDGIGQDIHSAADAQDK